MNRTSGELARHLGANLEGDANLLLSGVASPEQARAADLIYVDSPRHGARAESSAAMCVIAPPRMRLRAKTIIESSEPKLAFAKAAAWLLPRATPAPGIHPSAIVAPAAQVSGSACIGPHVVIEDSAVIGEKSVVQAFCFIGARSRVGAGCWLHPRVTLYAGSRLGNRVELHSGVVIGGDGFGYVFGEGRHWKFPQVGEIEIGDDVEIGSNTAMDRGSLGLTRVGSGTKIDNLVQVAHNVQIGEHSIIVSQTGISGSCTLGNRVIVGGQAGLGERCHIEDGAIVGGQSGVLPDKKVRSGQIVWGTPCRPLDRFRKQFAWLERLPELAARLRRLESGPLKEDRDCS
ncbi:MAG TPA: UDP-3-O-(3-hydroxymyristoyl)glucosamine N-acyltransferase [Candidatus Acidoferrales bacterium]|nr:UDP-3-O-(3-hydroxymyristoyl)glucosamine N-acyltransferase [Candidatus Acidoferrales bacterium]